MNLIGQRVKILSSNDPTKIGRTGKVVLESERTFLVDSDGRTIRVEKLGSAFQIFENGRIIPGDDLAGRLQERLGRSSA
jgi:RNase P/RNase MRP subunit p29